MRRIIVILLLALVVIGIYLTSQGGVPFKLPAVSDLKAPDIGSLLPSGPSGEKQPPAVPPQQVQQKYRVVRTVKKWSDSDPVKAKVFGQTSPGALVTKTNESKNGKTLVLDEKNMPYWIETSALVPVTQSSQSAPPAQKSTAPASADPGFTMPKIDPAAAVRSIFKAGTQIIESKGKSGPTTGPGGAMTAAWEFGNVKIWGGISIITILVLVYIWRKLTSKIASHERQGTLIKTLVKTVLLLVVFAAIAALINLPNLLSVLQSTKNSPTAMATAGTTWLTGQGKAMMLFAVLFFAYVLTQSNSLQGILKGITEPLAQLLVGLFKLALGISAIVAALALISKPSAESLTKAIREFPLVSYGGIIPNLMAGIVTQEATILVVIVGLTATILLYTRQP